MNFWICEHMCESAYLWTMGYLQKRAFISALIKKILTLYVTLCVRSGFQLNNLRIYWHWTFYTHTYICTYAAVNLNAIHNILKSIKIIQLGEHLIANRLVNMYANDKIKRAELVISLFVCNSQQNNNNNKSKSTDNKHEIWRIRVNRNENK